MKTPRVLVAAVAAGALLLSGCGAGDQAAVVDGHVISESGVLEAAAQLRENVQQPPGPNQVIDILITAPAVSEMLRERGVSISDEAARSAIPMIANPAPYVVEMVKRDLALRELSQEDQMQLMERIRESDVEVNPRYGSYDHDTLRVTPVVPDWFAETGAGS
ncbi:MAG: hypothetical protein Q4G67_10050 [Actinomycetia bacterium]|nr:hypothetical protein [Actinomycetes bacterium]